jgi:hypothetical protein
VCKKPYKYSDGFYHVLFTCPALAFLTPLPLLPAPQCATSRTRTLTASATPPLVTQSRWSAGFVQWAPPPLMHSRTTPGGGWGCCLGGLLLVLVLALVQSWMLGLLPMSGPAAAVCECRGMMIPLSPAPLSSLLCLPCCCGCCCCGCCCPPAWVGLLQDPWAQARRSGCHAADSQSQRRQPGGWVGGWVHHPRRCTSYRQQVHMHSASRSQLPVSTLPSDCAALLLPPPLPLPCRCA